MAKLPSGLVVISRERGAMGYDRNDCWMTCGEKDDRGETTVEDLTRLLDAAWPGGHREMAKAILSKYFVIPISSVTNGDQ